MYFNLRWSNNTPPQIFQLVVKTANYFSMREAKKKSAKARVVVREEEMLMVEAVEKAASLHSALAEQMSKELVCFKGLVKL